MLFFNNNLHFLLDLLHTALPSGNTCQICNKSLQKKCNCQMQLHLPVAQDNFYYKWTTKRIDRITYGAIGLNPTQDGLFRGCSRMRGEPFCPPP